MRIIRYPRWLSAFECSFFCVIGVVIIDVLSETESKVNWSNTITAGATYVTVVLLYYANKNTRNAQEDSERPHISVELHLKNNTSRVLVIRNVGKSAALQTSFKLSDVKDGLEIEAPLTVTGEAYRLRESPLFMERHDLTPGWQYEFLLRSGKEYKSDPNQHTYPRRFVVHVSYCSLRRTVYEDEFPIDIEAHKHSIVPQKTTGEQVGELRRRLEEELRGIKSELQAIRRRIM